MVAKTDADIQQTVVKKCEKLLHDNHFEHEEIIRFLQDAANPYAIPYLRQAVFLKPRLDYLDYDDYGAYYKKCFWALAAIGTQEAIEVIRGFVQSDNPVIKETALYRLSRLSPS